MTSEVSIACEVDEVLDAWRARAVGVLLMAVCAFTLLPLAAVLGGRIIVVPWALRAVCALLYLSLLAAALRPRWSLRRRAFVLFASIAVMAAIQLLVGRLAGNGRIVLLLLPFFALILVGPRAGWAALAVSAALFAGVPVLLQSDWAAHHVPSINPEIPFSYWGMQWLLWMNIVSMLLILLTLYERLQRRTMIAERAALRQLEQETADRRKLEAEVARIGEDERRQLGAELHDGLCQHLTATLLNCSVLEKKQKMAGSPEAVAAVGEIRSALEEAIGLAYDVARGLCPVDIEPDGLVPALESLCRDVRSRHGVGCRVRAQQDFAVRDSEQALHLYRIAGEAVKNAVKHAQCAEIVVELVREGGELVLRVSDDGRPGKAAGAPSGGLGARIMSYRAGLIGGVLELSDRPGGGRVVACRVPETEAKR